MANLRSKLYILLMIFMVFASAQMVAGQEADLNDDKSPVITQAIESAETGINYWTAEKTVSLQYCSDEEAMEICRSMEETCKEQISLWTAELDNQVRIGSQYIVHSSSYWQAKKYLGWAYDALKGIKLLYEKTHIRELQYIITAMEEAISFAEKIIAAVTK